MAYKDKKKQALSAKKHYLANKEKLKKRAVKFKNKARKRNRSFTRMFLLGNPCVDCGESDPVVLDFDHVRGVKRGNLANLVNRAVSIDTLIKEIKKCQIRCANCHRRKTALRRTYK